LGAAGFLFSATGAAALGLTAAVVVGAAADEETGGRREVRLVFLTGPATAGAFKAGVLVVGVLTASFGAADFA